MPKRKHAKVHQHPIDASGVLETAKFGRWKIFFKRLQKPNNNTQLTFDDFNELPPGRTFGVIHQISYHHHKPALERLIQLYPRVDLKLRTKDGQTALDVAEEEGKDDDDFLQYLRERIRIQTHHELINKARDGKWSEFFEQLNGTESEKLPEETINTVPSGRIWGILHQVCYWGELAVLEKLLDAYPDLKLDLETNEEAEQLPVDIAIGRGHKDFVTALRGKIDEQEKKKPTSLVTAASSSMKIPVPANGKLCNICFVDEHDSDTVAVSCDNDHHMCETCFAGWVESESDIESNPQSILINGGRITCVCKKSDGCDSLAYANKLIAMVVSDELYEKYLRARDYVVGKEAVMGALAKIKKEAGTVNAVEQEEIRNMYRKADGSYSAYMCGSCSFGPIDHGWCNDLSAHHGEKKKGGGNINNACPKCGWFATDINDWPLWDGKFQPTTHKS